MSIPRHGILSARKYRNSQFRARIGHTPEAQLWALSCVQPTCNRCELKGAHSVQALRAFFDVRSANVRSEKRGHRWPDDAQIPQRSLERQITPDMVASDGNSASALSTTQPRDLRDRLEREMRVSARSCCFPLLRTEGGRNEKFTWIRRSHSDMRNRGRFGNAQRILGRRHERHRQVTSISIVSSTDQVHWRHYGWHHHYGWHRHYRYYRYGYYPYYYNPAGVIAGTAFGLATAPLWGWGWGYPYWW